MLLEFSEAAKYAHLVQQKKLLSILRRNSDSLYGRKYGFAFIKNIEVFQKTVPVVTFAQLQPYLDRMVRGEAGVLVSEPVTYFALTSGTTGAAKMIPVTEGMIQEFAVHLNLWAEVFAHHFPNVQPDSFLNIAYNDYDELTESGTPYGCITHVLYGDRDTHNLNHWLPDDCFLVEDWDSRYYVILWFALRQSLSAIAALHPSSLVVLCQKLNQFANDLIADIRNGTVAHWLDITPELRQQLEQQASPNPHLADRLIQLQQIHGELRPKDVWTKLEGIACRKGGTEGFYLQHFSRWFGEVAVLDVGYMASEGVFATPLSTNGSQGALAICSHFFEFIPTIERDADPTNPFPRSLLAHEVEIGKEYYIVLTASNGLYRYDINDVVRVVGKYHNTPEIEFLHKGSRTISVSGELVGESHITTAIVQAASEVGLSLNGFSATARLQEMPRYVFAIEPSTELDSTIAHQFLKACDDSLKQANQEYKNHREWEHLAEPVLVTLERGSYDLYRQFRLAQGATDLRVKMPCIFPSEEALQSQLSVGREFSMHLS